MFINLNDVNSQVIYNRNNDKPPDQFYRTERRLHIFSLYYHADQETPETVAGVVER